MPQAAPARHVRPMLPALSKKQKRSLALGRGKRTGKGGSTVGLGKLARATLCHPPSPHLMVHFALFSLGLAPLYLPTLLQPSQEALLHRSIQTWGISTLRQQIHARHVAKVAFYADESAVEVLDSNGLQRRVAIWSPRSSSRTSARRSFPSLSCPSARRRRASCSHLSAA